MKTTKYPRARVGVLLAVVCGCTLVLHCGSVPEVLVESDDGFDGVCHSLYGAACDKSCGRDADCSSGLHCGSDGTCTAECDGDTVTCGGSEMCTERGRCEPTPGVGGSGSGGTGSIIMTTGSSGAAGDGGEGGGECGAVYEEATEVKRPMDIVVVIDNSASMEGEIVAVQERINSEFADIIDNSGIDYRVIMVSRYGNVFDENFDGGGPFDSAFSVCIGSPLSSLECPAAEDDPTPPVAHNPPIFYHHSTDIGSRNLWCRLLDAYDTSDPYPNERDDFVPIAEQGWQEFLRPDAFKVFIAITDDSPTTSGDASCAGTNFSDDLDGARAFDEALRTLAPEHFGAFDDDAPDEGRNYSWYSIVGMAGNDPESPTPLGPDEPVETLCCQGDGDAVDCPRSNNAPLSDGVRAGEGYQELSRLTGALRYPSCYNDNFDDVFNAIAEGVIEGAKLSCEWAIPDPPRGEVFDKNKVNVEYRPGGGGTPVTILKVPTLEDCGDSGGWYYDDEDEPTLVLACPATCDVLTADPAGQIGVLFGCETRYEEVH